jgi:hypothetical protein
MARAIRQEAEPVNADSFLDIVASVVCIMLIMVLMIGMRIRNTPVDPPLSPEEIQAGAELEKAAAQEHGLRVDLTKMAGEIEGIQRDTEARGLQRDMLATAVAAMGHELRTKRSQMDAQSQTDFDVGRDLAEVRRQLDEIRQRRASLETAAAEPIVVQSFPTPISRTVDNDEIHFHLRLGRVACVPLEKLALLARDDAKRKADKVIDRHDFMSKSRELPEFTEIVGPEGGFRLRYTAQRVESVEKSPQGPVRFVGLRISQWTAIPLAGQLGETADEALAQGSELRRALATMKPEKTTITIWVYPDSFDTFRRLRKELHDMGYAVAARPLPEGLMISGSPNGTKSEAE